MVIIVTLTVLLALATVLPKIPWASGMVRVCEFPRVQIAALTLLLIPATLVFGSGMAERVLVIAVLTMVVLAQGWACVMYTPLHAVQSLRHEGPAECLNRLRVLSANVKLSNRCFGDTVDLVRKVDPDIAIFMEVDADWLTALSALKSRMPHAVEQPRSNAYGMLVLSRLPLLNPEVRFLVFDTVPSVRTGVKLHSGDEIRLYAVHPEPPVPYEDTIGRDGELALIAADVKRDPLPAIVAGDLNDVAWSRTTRRFQRLSGLLDPRVGRGFFNTFHARFPGLRWPLDHLFHDPRFRLMRIERLPYVGSDHFPIMFELVLNNEDAHAVAVPRADRQDKEEADDVAADAVSTTRRPLGADWENST